MPVPAAKSILVVDDDDELCALIMDFLTPHGFSVEAVHDGRQGLARCDASGAERI
jgi:DNA-binding response OmpR family regulator